MVTGQADDALDEVVLGVLGKQPDKDEERRGSGPPTVHVPFVGGSAEPGDGHARVLEDDDVATLRSKGPGVSLLTMTRSSLTRVFSIDPDGM